MSASQPIVVRAPGKVFLLGEYAVLDGYGGLVGAVSKDVLVSWTEGGAGFRISGTALPKPQDIARDQLEAALTGPASRVAAGLLAARDVLGEARLPAGGALTIDSSALYANGRKLGFGSSAAVVVATLGALALTAGEDVTTLAFRQRAFTPARSWHNRAQDATGSGGDIAASLLGGVGWLRVGEKGAELLPVPAPRHVALLVHPQSASTPAQLASIKGYRTRDAAAVARHMRGLGELADAGNAALESRDDATFTRIVKEANTALTALGQDAGVVICTPLHLAAAAICESVGAASKPAGAGGGDLSLIAAPNADILRAAEAALARKGIPVTPLFFSAQGVSGLKAP